MNDKKTLRIMKCPKCGHEAKIFCVLSHWNDYVVRCSNCGFSYDLYEEEEKDAIRKWNGMVYKELTNK